MILFKLKMLIDSVLSHPKKFSVLSMLMGSVDNKPWRCCVGINPLSLVRGGQRGDDWGRG
jgi:hypothetical protein